MHGRIVYRFLWAGFLLLAALLLVANVYVSRQSPAIAGPLLAASLVILALAVSLSYLFVRSFSRRVAALRSYVERLLDPDASGEELPAGDDELGALARSLQRTAPRIRELVESLKLEGSRREAILSSMVEGVLALDKNLRVIFCNDSFARTVGARLPVVPGMPLLELVRDPGLRDIVIAVLETGQPIDRRLTLPVSGARSFEVLANPLAGAATRGVLAILHDDTRLERLERVRKDFVANVSHELRTPLAAISGYAETLLNGALEDQDNNRRFIEIILSQATRLTNIASDLLALSELESDGAAHPQQPVSVRLALESAVRTVESTARLRGVRIICANLPEVLVTGRQLRLEQVFVNLLDNAVKFNRPNGEVHVEMRRKDGVVNVKIADTGIGIPSEDLPRIFERFYRVDKARSRAMGGTGLGLSIVKHAVEQMGGAVRVDSRLGEGTEFSIDIPAA